MRKKSIFFICIVCISFILSIISACQAPKNISNQNLSYSYRKSENILHPQFLIQHISPTASVLHFSINTAELLYVKSGESTNFTARVALTYRLLKSYDAKHPLDTGSVLLVDKDFSDKPTLLLGKTTLNAEYPNNYVLEVSLQDLNRNISSKSVLDVYKNSTQSAQNFLLCDSAFRQPVFRNVIRANEKLFLSYTGSNLQQSKLFVRYYYRNFPSPAPAFSSYNQKPFDYRADSIFTLALDSQMTCTLLFPKQGFYHLQTDTNSKEGFTVYRFNDEFPYLTQPDDMVPMLRYITTRQEYDDLVNQQNKKKAIDDFWIKNAGGNNERARTVLKSYYTRVQESNLFFTSYCEGWKTDRGLIYTIFGQPNTLYKQQNSETWVYGEESSYKSLSFVFIKVINPFSENDYQLNRSDMFKDEWYRSVETWRQGKAYNEH